MITKVSKWWISLPKDYTLISRGFPAALPYQATDQDTYRMAYGRIKKQSPNVIQSWMPTPRTRGLQNNYREANWSSSNVTYRDGHREVNQERTEAMIRMTLTGKLSTMSLLNAELRDGEICNAMYKAASQEPEACFHQSEYDRLLWCLHIRYGSMVFHPSPEQSTSILPPPIGHRKCYMPITFTIPRAEAHIVWSHNGIYVMINLSLYHPAQFRQSSLPRLNFRKPKPNWITCQITEITITIPNHNYTVTEPQWQLTLNMTEK